MHIRTDGKADATGRWLTAALLGALSLTQSPYARADQWSVAGQASQSVLVDSNIRLSETDPQSVFGSITSLNSALGWASPRASVDLTGSASVRRYTGDSSLDGEDLGLNLRSNYRWPRSSLGVAASVRRASTLITEELDAGDFGQNAIQYSYLVQPTWQYRLTEIDNVSITGGWSQRLYQEGQFADADLANFAASWQRQLSPIEAVSLGFRASYIRTEDIAQKDTVQSYALVVGWNRRFSERLSIDATVGPRLVFQSIRSIASASRNVEVGTEAALTVNYNVTPLTSLHLQFSSSLEPVSLGGVQERQRVYLSLNHRFSERTSLQLFTVAQRNGDFIVARATSEASNLFLLSSASLSYRLSPSWSASIRYSFRTRQGEIDREFAFSHAVATVLTYSFRGWRFRD